MNPLSFAAGSVNLNKKVSQLQPSQLQSHLNSRLSEYPSHHLNSGQYPHPQSAYPSSYPLQGTANSHSQSGASGDDWRFVIQPTDLEDDLHARVFKDHVREAFRMQVHPPQVAVSAPLYNHRVHLPSSLQDYHYDSNSLQNMALQDYLDPVSSSYQNSYVDSFQNSYVDPRAVSRSLQNEDQRTVSRSLQNDDRTHAFGGMATHSPQTYRNSFDQDPMEEDDDVFDLELEETHRKKPEPMIIPMSAQQQIRKVTDSRNSLGSSAPASFPFLSENVVIHAVSPRGPAAKSTRASADKGFVCELCFATFSRNHDLKRHIRIHLGIRPYKCDVCSKTFTRQDALAKHVSIRGCKSK